MRKEKSKKIEKEENKFRKIKTKLRDNDTRVAISTLTNASTNITNIY